MKKLLFLIIMMLLLSGCITTYCCAWHYQEILVPPIVNRQGFIIPGHWERIWVCDQYCEETK